LEGLLLSAKASDDKYLYFAKIEKNTKNMKTLRREFGQQAKNPLHAEFDRGYFQALEAYARILEQSNPVQQTLPAKKEE